MWMAPHWSGQETLAVTMLCAPIKLQSEVDYNQMSVKLQSEVGGVYICQE